MDEGIFQNKRKGGKLGNSYLNVRYKIVLSMPTPKKMVIFNAMHRGVVNQGKYQKFFATFSWSTKCVCQVLIGKKFFLKH